MSDKPMILSALDLSYFNVIQRVYLLGGRRKFIQRSHFLNELLGRTALVALSLAALESCDQPSAASTGQGLGSGSADSDVAVSLGVPSLSLTVGGFHQMAFAVSPSATADKNLVWSSSDPAVASVSSDGLVTALSPGSATITVARAAGIETASCEVAVAAFSEPGIPIAGLVAEWLYEGNSNDTSGNGIGGINHGVTLTADRFGAPDKAFNFDGSSSYVDCGNKSALDLTKDFSIAAWICPDTFGSNEGIVSKAQTSGVTSYALRLGSASPYKTVNFGGIDSTYTINAGTWYLLVVTVDSSGNGTLFINGVPSGTAVMNLGTGDDPVIIGRDYGSRYFDGAIDDVRIYGRVLSDGEIQTLVTAGGFVADTNLTVYTPPPPPCSSNCPSYSCTCVSFYCSCVYAGCPVYGIY